VTIVLESGDGQPLRIPGDFRRNSQGRPWVTNPTGTGKELLYHRPSSLWVFDDYTGIDPIYAERGTHVHSITEHADRNEALTPEFVERGVELGIPAPLQHRIYARWIVFLKAHGLTVETIEEPCVNDEWRTAGTRDRIVVESRGGLGMVGDIKTGSDPVKVSYLVQLAAYAASVAYDPESGERAEHTPCSLVDAYIFHWPMAAALRGDDVDWQLIAVDLVEAFHLGQRLVELRDMRGADVAHHFQQIATPDERTANVSSVESPDGVTDPPVTVTPSKSLDDLRSVVMSWEPDMRREFGDFLTRESVDRDDPEQVAAAIDRYTFADVHVDPAPTPEPVTLEPLPEPPIEGDTVDADEVAKVGARFGKLDAAATSWVSECGRLVRLNPASGGVASVRRRDLIVGLLELAEGRYDNDDAVRAVLAHIIGDVVWQGSSVADAVASLTVEEAQHFAGLCALVATSNAPFEFPSDGRTVLVAA
jgi:hypothetical protein